MTFDVHPQLNTDCISLGSLNTNRLLLHKNALVPWFILLPDTSETELYHLEHTHQQHVQMAINQVAGFIELYFKPDKLNIATIGNIVPQLHVHIIGRFKKDFCWPHPVWGQTQSAAYQPEQLTLLKTEISKHLLLD